MIVNSIYGGGKNPRKSKTKVHSEDDIIKDVRNLFTLKNRNKAIKSNAIESIRNLFY